MSIPGDLERARGLAFAADESAARDLLLTLMPRIERADRDDLMLEVFAQLGEIYLARGANDGVSECIRRIRDCLDSYARLPAGGARAEVTQMICRYSRRAQFLRTGLAAARGDHEAAADELSALETMRTETGLPDLDREHAHLLTSARVACATALGDDDLHERSVPLWEKIVEAIDGPGGSEPDDHLHVAGATGYARFCVQTGRLSDAEPWLARAGARAHARGWELAAARTQLERAAARWSAGDHLGTERLLSEAYPVIARYARAHDVSRCWLYFGLTRMAAGALQAADECWGHAERHWRELGKPLHIHRILLQRSGIAVVRGRYREAAGMIAEARRCLDSAPRSNWLQYARLDDHLGTVWRAEALAELGFDGAGRPDDDWRDAEARYQSALGVTRAEVGSPRHRSAMAKLERAAELKVPAALAVDSVRYTIAEPEARLRWAHCVSGPILAGAFAAAWEWQHTALIGELIEYHSARGTFTAEPGPPAVLEWARVATAPAPVGDAGRLAEVAAGPSSGTDGPLTRLHPLPPLRMEPGGRPVLARYRELAWQRYGRTVTSDEDAWSTWP